MWTLTGCSGKSISTNQLLHESRIEEAAAMHRFADSVPATACRASYASCTGYKQVLQLEAVLGNRERRGPADQSRPLLVGVQVD